MCQLARPHLNKTEQSNGLLSPAMWPNQSMQYTCLASQGGHTRYWKLDGWSKCSILPHSSGGRKSKIKVLAEPHFFQGSEEILSCLF